jgi:hypothetical protein
VAAIAAAAAIRASSSALSAAKFSSLSIVL